MERKKPTNPKHSHSFFYGHDSPLWKSSKAWKNTAWWLASALKCMAVRAVWTWFNLNIVLMCIFQSFCLWFSTQKIRRWWQCTLILWSWEHIKCFHYYISLKCKLLSWKVEIFFWVKKSKRELVTYNVEKQLWMLSAYFFGICTNRLKFQLNSLSLIIEYSQEYAFFIVYFLHRQEISFWYLAKSIGRMAR